MTLNQLFSTFYLIFRFFLHIEIDEYPKKNWKTYILSRFFLRQKKTGYTLGVGYTLGAGRIYQVQIFTLQ
jgi:hypothetical protein